MTALLASAEEEQQRAIDELPELAHGICPAVLTEAGIGPALWTMADPAPAHVEVGELPNRPESHRAVLRHPRPPW